MEQSLLDKVREYLSSLSISLCAEKRDARRERAPPTWDDWIRFPNIHGDIPVVILVLIAILPSVFLMLHVEERAWRRVAGRAIFRYNVTVGIVCLLIGLVLSLVFTAVIKIATCRLAPNFYHAYEPEINQSFPCLYSSLAGYGAVYLLFYVWRPSKSDNQVGPATDKWQKIIIILICITINFLLLAVSVSDQPLSSQKVAYGVLKFQSAIIILIVCNRVDAALKHADSETSWGLHTYSVCTWLAMISNILLWILVSLFIESFKAHADWYCNGVGIAMLVYGAFVVKTNWRALDSSEVIVLISAILLIVMPLPESDPVDTAKIVFIVITMIGPAVLVNAHIYLYIRVKLFEPEEATAHPSPPIPQGPTTPPRIGVCSSAYPESTEGFVRALRERLGEKAARVEYIQLPYNKLDDFPLEKELNKRGIDILILCHSIDNRRLSLTNVTDALYDKFIRRASQKVGKDSLIVIAHDFKWSPDDNETRSALIGALQFKQPDTHKYAGTVLLAGKLKSEGSVGVCEQDWQTLEGVVQTRSRKQLY